MSSFDFKDFLKSVSGAPGVYLMKNREDEVLYVGKAKDLKKRLSSYARTDLGRQSKTVAMLARVVAIDTIVTNSEKEALILEASLIKQYRPKYNVILRDDKNYPWLKVTVQEGWPRLVMTRRRGKDGARYFGPFSSSSAMWETLKHLNSIFPLRRCADKELKQKKRPCLNHQMNRCLAPCVGKISHEQYLEMVQQVILVLDGKNRQLVKELQARMEQASAALHFEEAALLRDRIKALGKTLEKQQVVSQREVDQDVFGLVRQGAAIAVAIMFIRKGVITGQQSFFLADPVGDDGEILSEVVARFYSEERLVPQEILVPLRLLDEDPLASWLGDLAGHRVQLIFPRRGDKLGLLEMARSNAEQVLAVQDKKDESWLALSRALQKKLNLTVAPNRIECLDISNISGQQAVGALVCFVNGQKMKQMFRHYRIREVDGPNDYAMMAEVIGRRFAPGDKLDELPDLFMVDGGKGQLQVALAVLSDLGLKGRVELVGIAKERAEEGEKLYRPGRKNPILLPVYSPVLLYLMKIRDESHRYGVTFHRSLRKKKAFASELDKIDGIGRVRKEALLKSLGSMARIRAASLEQLAGIEGVGPDTALRIWQYLHPGEAD
ncbi:MAG: excinuclease ABC subunit UvrC [Desulfobulbaceae bacterium]|nr:excinuclease ABC subunit UvrC [Desulfobulbaceae bacterium]HIJ79128.1 excinuclease ABC subunit UvrC [Deltaproteobacteria bacterium]